MIKKLLTGGAMAVALALGAAPAQSAVVFTFDTEFSGGTEPAGTPPWLTMTLTDAGANQVLLSIDASGLTGTEFIGVIDFNLNPLMDPDTLSFAYQAASTGPAASVSTGINAFKPDGDGFMDIELDFPQSGGNRFSDGEVVQYLITGTGLDETDFNFASVCGQGCGTGSHLAAAHVQGIGAQEDDSGWIAPGNGGPPTQAVEPGTVGLMAIALLGLAGLHRRRRRA